MHGVPSEFNLFGVYLPPLLIASGLGLAMTVLTARLLDRCRLSRYFFYPPLVFLGLAVLYTVIIGTFVVPA